MTRRGQRVRTSAPSNNPQANQTIQAQYKRVSIRIASTHRSNNNSYYIEGRAEDYCTRNTGAEWWLFIFTQYALFQVSLSLTSLSQVSTLYTVLILDGAPNQHSHQAFGAHFTLSPTVPPRR